MIERGELERGIVEFERFVVEKPEMSDVIDRHLTETSLRSDSSGAGGRQKGRTT
jgi:hypothetical protein